MISNESVSIIVFHCQTCHQNCISGHFLYSGNALQSLEKKYEEEKSRAEQLAKYVYVYYTHNLYYERNINVLITKRKPSSYLLQRKQRIAGRH